MATVEIFARRNIRSWVHRERLPDGTVESTIRRRRYVTKTEAEAKAGEHLAADGDAEVSRIPEFVDVGIGLVVVFIAYSAIGDVVWTLLRAMWDAIR